MAKVQDKTETSEAEEPSGPIGIDSDEREGNDIPALLGSGAPQIKVKANVGWGSGQVNMRVGQVATLVQTEEVRLNIQNGNLSLVEE